MRGNYLYTKIGKRIAIIRRVKKQSQFDLALLSFMDRSALVRIETGKTNPTLKTLHKIALGLNVRMQDLFIDV